MRFVCRCAFSGLELRASYDSRAMAKNGHHERLSSRHRMLIYETTPITFLSLEISERFSWASTRSEANRFAFTPSAATGQQRWTSSLRKSKVGAGAFVNARLG